MTKRTKVEVDGFTIKITDEWVFDKDSDALQYQIEAIYEDLIRKQVTPDLIRCTCTKYVWSSVDEFRYVVEQLIIALSVVI